MFDCVDRDVLLNTGSAYLLLSKGPEFNYGYEMLRDFKLFTEFSNPERTAPDTAIDVDRFNRTAQCIYADVSASARISTYNPERFAVTVHHTLIS